MCICTYIWDLKTPSIYKCLAIKLDDIQSFHIGNGWKSPFPSIHFIFSNWWALHFKLVGFAMIKNTKGEAKLGPKVRGLEDCVWRNRVNPPPKIAVRFRISPF